MYAVWVLNWQLFTSGLRFSTCGDVCQIPAMVVPVGKHFHSIMGCNVIRRHNEVRDASVSWPRGCCVPPIKKRGEEARGFTTVRGAPQNGDGRTCVRQAERTKSYAMLCGWATWGRFLCFLRGSGRFGSTVTNISGSTGYLTSETN